MQRNVKKHIAKARKRGYKDISMSEFLQLLTEVKSVYNLDEVADITMDAYLFGLEAGRRQQTKGA